jgi:outer membrane lipoprotein carrier protein
LALIPVCACCANPPLEALFKGVETRYNRAQSLQVFFHEAYSAPQRPKRTESGTLRLRKPGRMRWDYTQPAGKLFVSDGKQVYLYLASETPPRVEKMKLKDTEDMRAPLAFLLGKLNFEKEFQNIQTRAEGDGTLVAAEPKADTLPYSKVEFLVSPTFEIRKLHIVMQDQSVLELAFENEKLNPPLANTLFQFTPPAGAQVVEGGS